MTAISTTGPAPHPRSRLRARIVLAGFTAAGLAALAWAAFVQPLPLHLPRLLPPLRLGLQLPALVVRQLQTALGELPVPAQAGAEVPRSLRSAATCRPACRCSNV